MNPTIAPPSALFSANVDPPCAAATSVTIDSPRPDPGCDRAHYQLGVIARVEGDVDRAERHFRDAVRANPKHLEANQELRLIEMRKKNSGKKGGLFR